jgi:dihydrofolate synthase/folylpolyglutamate synthase
MSYAAAVESLYALGHELATDKLRKFDLAEMRVLMEAMGHPERRYATVLVAGTNGKGSTSATLASILETAGYGTALYTSPHLVRLNERMRVNGEHISDVEFAEMYDRVEQSIAQIIRQGKLPHHPSFFETVTAMAFEYFASRDIEIAVLEIGMGGRLDATNIAEPCVSIITDIDLDHQQYLGDTIAAIAKEKCGILRKHSTLVTLPQHPQANEVIGHCAEAVGCKAVSAARYVPNISPGAIKFDHLRPTATQSGQFFRTKYFLELMGEEILIDSPLIGRHQLRNVALAIAAAVELNDCGFKINPQQIQIGVHEADWPGRFQLLPGSPDIVLDVAHNPAGAWALRSALSESFEGRPLTFVFGAMRDKAFAEMAQILFPMAEHVVLTHAQTQRAASEQDLAQAAARTGSSVLMAASVQEAVARARELTPRNGVIVITGSIYVVGEAMAALA